MRQPPHWEMHPCTFTTSSVRARHCVYSLQYCAIHMLKRLFGLCNSMRLKKIAQSWSLTTTWSIKPWELVNSLKCSTTDLKSWRPEDYFMTYSDRHHLFLCETVDIANIGTVYFNPLFSETAVIIGDCFISLDTRLIYNLSFMLAISVCIENSLK